MSKPTKTPVPIPNKSTDTTDDPNKLLILHSMPDSPGAQLLKAAFTYAASNPKVTKPKTWEAGFLEMFRLVQSALTTNAHEQRVCSLIKLQAQLTLLIPDHIPIESALQRLLNKDS